MKRLVLRAAVALIAVGAGLATVPAAHADPDQTQTLHFTADNPGLTPQTRYGERITAASDSGLPVTITVDPTSPACYGGGEPSLIYGNVFSRAAGRCTVWADQPGDEHYLPAQRIEMTFEFDRMASLLLPEKASKGALGLSPTTFRANLLHDSFFGPGGGYFPYVGKAVTFYVGGKKMCSATTVSAPSPVWPGSTAFATCKAAIGLNAALKQKTFTATFAGDDQYYGTAASGTLQ